MRRCSDTVCSLLVTGLLVAFLVGCSKSEETRQAGKPQIGQTNAVTAQCINTQTGESSPDSEDAAENGISDLKAKAEKGDAEAQYKLGLDYESGVFGVAGQSEAVKWYQKAADQGWTSAVARLGAIYGEADSPLYEPKESFRLTERAAAAGDVRSQVSLGFKYVEGLGVATNSDEGLRWITRGIAAMEDLVAKAMARTNARFEAVARQVDINICACRLGKYYTEGQLLPRELTKAIYWYEKAKDAPQAQFQLGWIHLTQTKNYPEAAKWLSRAAEAGHATAQENLGGLYYQGLGVVQDYTEALKWFRLAAQAGEPPAERLLGVFYENGYGVARDYAEAAQWYRKAAEQGDALGQTGLAFLYLNGLGVPRDYVEGYKWADLAAVQGNDTSRKNRDAASRFMTPDQVAEAQRRSSTFVAHKENEAPQKSRHVVADLTPKFAGTGFLITEDGYLLTSAHVIENAARIEIFADGRALAAKLVKVDAVNDVALLKVKGSYKAVSLVTSRGVKLGDFMFTIGFPSTVVQGTEPKLTQGEVSSLAGIQDDPRHFQVSVPVQPGNSGGPLVDRFGNVVGIVSARLGDSATLQFTGSLPQNVSYALKSCFVTTFLQTLPEVSTKLKAAGRPGKDRPLSEVVAEVKQSIVLVTVY